MFLLAPQQALQQIPPRHRASSTTYILMGLIVHLKAVITAVYIVFPNTTIQGILRTLKD